MSRRGSLWVWFSTIIILTAAYFAYDGRYWTRHVQGPPDSRIVFDIDWYEPRVRIGEGAGRDIPVAATDQRSVDQAALDQVVSYAKELDSYALIVARDGIIQAEYYKDGFGPDSLFDTGSMHKGLLSIAFGVALDNGLIPTLDMPAATYLPEWKDDERRAITIRHLIANTSGLAELTFSEVPWSAGYLSMIDEAPPRTAFFLNPMLTAGIRSRLARTLAAIAGPQGPAWDMAASRHAGTM